MHHTYIYIYITHKNILKPIFHLAIISLFNIALLSPTIPPAGNRSIGRHHPRLSPSSNLAIRKSSSPLASIAGICVREKWNPRVVTRSAQKFSPKCNRDVAKKRVKRLTNVGTRQKAAGAITADWMEVETRLAAVLRATRNNRRTY